MTVDRAVLGFAGGMTLLSALLVVLFSPWWLLLTAFVGANMMQASITGFARRRWRSKRWAPSRAAADAPRSRRYQRAVLNGPCENSIYSLC